MLLIVGLGNIGTEYENTRHNIGFMTVDKLKEDYDFPNFKEKNKYFFTKKGDIILAKPTTYMNLSGEAVLALSSLYKIKPEDIIIIHDDLDLETGRIKIKQGGSNGGHNGLKSIDKTIGVNYHRVRIGIDHPRNFTPKIDVVNYVLGKFKTEEKEKIEKSITTISQNFDNLISKNFDKILSKL
ncbi:MAG: aminoacyl-tRNA hydrolase [Alphaproteobacteria bacterium]|nr:aminoacyl-tRNA hydrolase [Alphaproteobacteria bacterium]